MTDVPSFNAIFACLSAPQYYRERIVSDREVFVGPDCETVFTEGRCAAVKTPNGEYDMAALVADLPADQRPDMVVVKADASLRNIPRNLRQVDCARVLLVGDTHHMQHPLANVLRYAMEEPYDYIVMDHTRHHGHFFLEAGFPQVYWIPAFDYVLRQRPIASQTEATAVFVGQFGRFHPYRRHVLSEVMRAGLPLRTQSAPPEVAADIYAAARVTLNCSLNGDLNLRVFEVMGSGGLLLTDRLTRQSGLELLFEEGRHLEAYRSAGELVEKARHYLDHPEEAERLRRQGQQEVLDRHHPDIKRRQLFDIVFNQKVEPELDLVVDDRCRTLVAVPSARFQPTLALYEMVQELHRISTSVVVFADLVDDALPIRNLADLPRVVLRPREEALDAQRWAPRLIPGPDTTPVDEYVLCLPADAETGGLDRRLAAFMGRFLVLSAGTGRRRHPIDRILANWGYVRIHPQADIYECRDIAAHVQRAFTVGPADLVRRKVGAILPFLRTAKDRFAAAGILRALGEVEMARTLLARAVQYDRDHAPSLSMLAQALDDAANPVDAALVLLEKRRTLGLDSPEEQRLATLEQTVGKVPAVETYRTIVSPIPARTSAPLRVLVVTNLFPPQEMGGYGRKLWEFAGELHRRGHMVKVLTADAAYLRRDGAAGDIDLEPLVERSLELYGRWEQGRVVLEEEQAVIARAMVGNAQTVARVIGEWQADVCLFGNIDFIGLNTLQMILNLNVPVLHCIGSFNPGYPVQYAPQTPLYRPGPASEWVMSSMREQGYAFDAHTVVYPGARVDYFYRHFQALPDIPRIVFASLVLPYKGPQLLVQACALLASRGIDFDCTFAGDTTEPRVVEELKAFCQRAGIGEKVRFVGFVDRPTLRHLFADRNILVFPSTVNEAFGIAQVEAMASGLTVVTSATGGAGEIIRHGIDGLVFENGNATDLAEKLGALVANRAAWGELSLRGRTRALDFSVPRSVDAILGAFDTLLRVKSAMGTPPVPAPVFI